MNEKQKKLLRMTYVGEVLHAPLCMPFSCISFKRAYFKEIKQNRQVRVKFSHSISNVT